MKNANYEYFSYNYSNALVFYYYCCTIELVFIIVVCSFTGNAFECMVGKGLANHAEVLYICIQYREETSASPSFFKLIFVMPS